MCSRGPRIPLLGSSVTVLVGSTSFPTIYRVFSMRAGFESDVSSLFFFPASPCRIEHIAGTHDYLLNEWMDGWTNPRKAECELSIVLICVLQRNIIRKIDQHIIFHLSTYPCLALYLPYLSIIYLPTC